MADEREDDEQECPVCPEMKNQIRDFLRALEGNVKTPVPGHHPDATAEAIVTANAAEAVINRLILETGNPFYVAHFLVSRTMQSCEVVIVKKDGVTLRGKPGAEATAGAELRDLSDDELRELSADKLGKA